MSYQAKNFNHLIGLGGFSEQLLKNHFTLYEGYVANVNKLGDTITNLKKEEKFGTPEYAELNRRLGWEFNGMRLHEYYFENLTKDFREMDKNSGLFSAILKEFGSYKMWEKDFKFMGVIRGIGWIILYHDKLAGRLFNVWINEHDVGHFAGAEPILVMDVFEHAFMLDYGLKKADYIEAFLKTIDWEVADLRYAQSK